MAIDKIQTAGLGENIEIGGTEAARMPVGTEAQRANPQVGDLRHNTNTGYLEQYTADGWASIAASPVVSSISPTAIPDTDSSFAITINGSNFSSGATVQAIGQDGSTINATSTARTSGSVLVATFDGTQFADAQEDYSIKVSNNTGLAYTLSDSLAVNASPAWTTAASPTTLATVNDGDTISGSTIQVAATDDEGATLTYSLSSGSLPTGLTVNSNGTITGTESGSETYSAGGTTFTPTLAVTDGTNSVTRTFAIVKKWYDGSTSALATTTTYLAANDIDVSSAYLQAPSGASGIGVQQYDVYHDSTNNDYYIKLPGSWIRTNQQSFTLLDGNSNTNWNYGSNGFAVVARHGFDIDIGWSFTKYFLYMHSTYVDGSGDPDDTKEYTNAQFTGLTQNTLPAPTGSHTTAYVSRSETDANGNSLTLTPSSLMLNAYPSSNDGDQTLSFGTPGLIHPWKRGGEFAPNFQSPSGTGTSTEIMFNMMPGSGYTNGTLSISNTAGTSATNYRNFPASAGSSAQTKLRVAYYDNGSEVVEIPDVEMWVNGT